MATNLPRFPSEQRAQGKYFFLSYMKHYTEKPLTFEEQIALLRQRGLDFVDVGKAQHVLSHVSYFRMKSYLTPLTSNKEQWIFKPDVTFAPTIVDCGIEHCAYGHFSPERL